jgi:hypothetical protein
VESLEALKKQGRGQCFGYAQQPGRGATVVDGSPRLLQVAWQKGRGFYLFVSFVAGGALLNKKAVASIYIMRLQLYQIDLSHLRAIFCSGSGLNWKIFNLLV